MDDWQVLRRASQRFESEVARVVEGNWVSMPMPLIILVDALESEPILRAHLESCTEELEATGFDAEATIDRVAEAPGTSFGPFAPDNPLDLARAYLLAQTLSARGYRFDDSLFAAYGPETPRHQERFERFVADVVMPLIDGARIELERRREALGPCPYELDEVLDEDTRVEEAAPVNVTPELLSSLLDALDASVATLPAADQQDVALQLEALRDELSCEQPKPRVAAALLRVLRMLGGSAEFLQALAPLEQAVALLG